VTPDVVLEVGFDGIQRSDRHASGFSLRFPRIIRIRDDKTPDACDTLETVEALFRAQVASGHREEGAPPAKPRTEATTPTPQLSLFSEKK
jgi:DNA ligase-1